MNISKLKGMRYPDEFLIRMFYKEGLFKTPGKALELGSGSCNNLLHFASYGWEVTGIDWDANSLSDGNHNLLELNLSGNLIHHDLNSGLPNLNDKFDAFLCPSTLYYLNRDATWKCLFQIRELLAPGAIVYLRMRRPDDYRSGKGKHIGQNAWYIDYDHTGELGATNVFWDKDEIFNLLEKTLAIKPQKLTALKSIYENIQNGNLIYNSDLVVWGRVE